MEKIINWITFGPLKGSRSKFGILAAGIALLLEQFGLVSMGALTNDTMKIVWGVLQSYFVIEHFESK